MFSFTRDGFNFQVVYVMITANLSAHRFNILGGKWSNLIFRVHR